MEEEEEMKRKIEIEAKKQRLIEDAAKREAEEEVHKKRML